MFKQFEPDCLNPSLFKGLEFDVESKRQEDSLRRFRMKECNLLISSSHLEVGVDNVRCNLVVAFDIPRSFKDYTNCKVKAKANKAHYLIFCNEDEKEEVGKLLNQFAHTEAILKANCTVPAPISGAPCEAHINEESDKKFNPFYSINRYCSKLPSDTL